MKLKIIDTKGFSSINIGDEFNLLDKFPRSSYNIQYWYDNHPDMFEVIQEIKSNKQLAKEYLYNTLTNKTISIKTTLDNRDKFYKLLELLDIRYFKYVGTDIFTDDRYSLLHSKYNDRLEIIQDVNPWSELKTIDFEQILKEYKQTLNK